MFDKISHNFVVVAQVLVKFAHGLEHPMKAILQKIHIVWLTSYIANETHNF